MDIPSAWTGPERAPDLAVKCDSECDWSAALTQCSRLREGIHCRLEDNFSCGTRKLVRKIRFDDGVGWVICVWMRIQDDCEPGFRSEAATYHLLSEKTNLPTPKCHDWKGSSNNPIGRAYIIVDLMEGTRAALLPQGPYLHPGTPEQWQYLVNQMAEYQVELASLTFQKIGALFDDEKGDTVIGKDIWINRGPFDTAQEFYTALSTASQLNVMNGIKTSVDLQLKNQNRGFLLPSYFNMLMPRISESHNDIGPFRLANLDFGLHNLLVDENFRITGIIDLDGIIAAPLPVVAQFPIHPPFQQIAPPGCKDLYDSTDWSGITDLLYSNHAKAYIAAISNAERRRVGPQAATPISDAFESVAAMFVRALTIWGLGSVFEGELWMSSLLFLTVQAMSKRFQGAQAVDFSAYNLQHPQKDLTESTWSDPQKTSWADEETDNDEISWAEEEHLKNNKGNWNLQDLQSALPSSAGSWKSDVDAWGDESCILNRTSSASVPELPLNTSASTTGKIEDRSGATAACETDDEIDWQW
ncbi:MAG: hypothetical protein Q9227_000129 [Pyrenula ochraceoflavens]